MKILLDDKRSNLTVSSNVARAPRMDGALFCRIKNKVLGRKYELSVVFVGTRLAKKLNKEYRGKNYATDILSFPLDAKTGEIFINPDKARSKAKEFDRTPAAYLLFIFIHGLFHLKGFDHGSTMESKEARVRKLFKI